MVTTSPAAAAVLDEIAQLCIDTPYITGWSELTPHSQMNDQVLRDGRPPMLKDIITLIAQDDPDKLLAYAFALSQTVTIVKIALSEYFSPRTDPGSTLTPSGVSIERAMDVYAALEYMHERPVWIGGTIKELAEWTLKFALEPIIRERLGQPLVGQQNGEGMYHSRESALARARTAS